MIAMQYSFTLPADYDMDIIRRRIAEKGPALDDYAGLHFKAYLYAECGRDNLYAPFYLWPDAEQMQRFLDGPVFSGVTAAFGWPSIRLWPVWKARLSAQAREARFATREIAPIVPYSALADLKRSEGEALDQDAARGALAAVSAFDPTGWSALRFRLWRDLSELPADPNCQIYALGHLSQPTPTLE